VTKATKRTPYAERLAAFAERGPFVGLPGDYRADWPCDCCGSKALKHCGPVRDASGKMWFIGSDCYRNLYEMGIVTNKLTVLDVSREQLTALRDEGALAYVRRRMKETENAKGH